ncbi:carboxylating nicotinate-nucleotide diphosphorylase [Clostridium botulinum]|uniref:Probable nicotinate-nucleotide pyrophosphorylase [carboxylating] n=1 Tax=Clostridium botulinum TaxID=1491 RepID=A0A6B4JIK5_CLOBO|nr:carboxylating nicotinate-nucleotide diphosphorylase [Clostridium botulinum]EES50099.1 nicotinate-nucleotide diphosphorylase (carboxylating) [Clostridium botulinum E1 str. 'BoNT E Beluga']MBN1065800.1 carboxylating nicotinate-nucleotide diphosphorylase [Clostridium botulinum]MBN1072164.1 carboxylating nicotinate-nucleotide diphosphorylase [Clostridium botulinum]MBY6759781.1 carboxylating nicotinate-nucleotide diphosphorylase [Clostridium botulinum]MBY6918690.1 carboxylating nicotinate-nucleo
MNYLVVDKIIKEALLEDIPNEDITTNSIIKESSICTVDLLCKEKGILSGLEVFKRVFDILGNVQIEFNKKDGDKICPGEKIALLKGDTRNVLLGERVALNLLQRMSGIATVTNKFVNKIEHTRAKLLDTRKTTPNLRILEKYSVKIGGGDNHRFNLSDGIMLKDNHISAAGGIKKAVEMCKKNSSFVRKIEVEAETLDMVNEALEAKVDIIMLDNMNLKTAKEAVRIINNRVLIEFSGNVNIDNIKEIAEIGVDYISVGALTHSAKILDLSMKNLSIVD